MPTKNLSFRQQYQQKTMPTLVKSLSCSNIMQVPVLQKIVVNVGMGSYLKGSKDYQSVVDNITAITGQKPVVRHARMSISNFKLREGMPVGVSVTLRGEAAYNFLAKMIHIVLPRVRGFRGIKTSALDPQGNLSFGISEHNVFPETMMSEVHNMHGIQITIVTSTTDKNHSHAMLEALGFPFVKPVISNPTSNGS